MACPSPNAELSDTIGGDSLAAYQLQPTPNPVLPMASEHVFVDASALSSNGNNNLDDNSCELEESEDNGIDEDTFSTVSLKDIDVLVSFYETLLKHSVNTDAFHAISKITLDIKDLKLSHGEYPKDLQATLGDRLYLAAQLNDYCVVCLSLVPHHENLSLKIRCPTCQAVEFCSGFCSLEQNTHPCRLLNKLRMMSRCKDTYIETYRDKKNMVIERACILEAHHAEALALDAQKEELIRRRGEGCEVMNLPESNAERVLTESDNYILTTLQPICNILGLTRQLYTKKDKLFLKELAESSFTIADLRVKDPFTYAFILKIAFLFSGGMTKVQQEKEKLANSLKEIRKMSAEFDFNYSFLHQTLTDLQKIMITASTETTDLASIQSVYQACRNTLKLTDKIKFPEQCQAALNDIRKIVYFWNEIRMSNHLIDMLNKYYDFVKGINLYEARKKQLQQESTSLTEQIKECQENIAEAKQATTELQSYLDKLKIGIFPSTGPSPAEDTGSVAIPNNEANTQKLGRIKSHGNLQKVDTNINGNAMDSFLKGHSLSTLSTKPPSNSNSIIKSINKASAPTNTTEKSFIPQHSHNPDGKSNLNPQDNVDIAGNYLSIDNTSILNKKPTDSQNILTLSAADDVESKDNKESDRLQKHGNNSSKVALDNLLSFSDVIVSINDIISASSSPQPQPQPPTMETLNESVSAEGICPIKRNILEHKPLLAPLSQCDGSSEIPCLKISPRFSQTLRVESPSSKSVPNKRVLELKHTPVGSAHTGSKNDHIIDSESDPLRLATIARPIICTQRPDGSQHGDALSSTRSSSSDQAALEFNEAKNRESTTMKSPTFGAEMMDSTGNILQKQQDCPQDPEPRVRESSNLHTANAKLSTEDMFSVREKSDEIDNVEELPILHSIQPNPSINILSKTTEECEDVVHSCIRNSIPSTAEAAVTTVINQTENKASIDHTSAITDLDMLSQTFELDLSSQTESATGGDGHENDERHVFAEISVDNTINPLKTRECGSKCRSLSARYKEMYAKMVRQRSIFDVVDSDKTPKKTKQPMQISSMPKNLLDINVTTENSNILACFNKPPENSKLNRIVQLNPQKISQYLNDLTISMYTTEVIFLVKVWKAMSRGLLLLGRINSYYSKKAVAMGETYADRIVGTREQQLVKRAYGAIHASLINIKFEYYSYIKLCYLRFNMSVGTAKNCKWKSSDDVLKFSLTDDQYKRLKQTNALRINTGKMNDVQREALYKSLKNYIMDGIQIDINEILRTN